jgi:transcriptional regulator GlxA family with amidase domain
MQLLKRLRLQEAHRKLQDPTLTNTSIKNIMTAVGYARPDQFARDFRQLFGVSPREIRRLAGERPS